MYDIWREQDDTVVYVCKRLTEGRAKQRARNASIYWNCTAFVTFTATGRFGQRLAQFRAGQHLDQEAVPY